MQLIDIGNSKGIRLPKNIISKYHFENGIELVESDNHIKLVPLRKKLREGWNSFFMKHCENIESDIDLDFLDCDIGNWCE
jgi:antitoxin MazE